MRTLGIACLLGLSIAFSIPASAEMSAANCKAMWNKADTNNDGIVTGAEAGPYAMAMAQAKLKSMDANFISDIEFMEACHGGAFNDQMAPPIGPG
jgi:hypothetical protein